MLSLNLPAFDAKIAARNGKNVIFDVIRRRYVALTPEEWVRQHFVHFLLAHKGYPQALMANEEMCIRDSHICFERHVPVPDRILWLYTNFSDKKECIE